jgi:hypothetical protein
LTTTQQSRRAASGEESGGVNDTSAMFSELGDNALGLPWR